jgi:hypothetical protein
MSVCFKISDEVYISCDKIMHILQATNNLPCLNITELRELFTETAQSSIHHSLELITKMHICIYNFCNLVSTSASSAEYCTRIELLRYFVQSRIKRHAWYQSPFEECDFAVYNLDIPSLKLMFEYLEHFAISSQCIKLFNYQYITPDYSIYEPYI